MEQIKPSQPSVVEKPPMTEEQKRTLAILTQKMYALGVNAKPLSDLSVGPLITTYRFVPQDSTKVSQIENLSEDFSLILGKEVMVKRLPGETSVSVTVPNDQRTDVPWLPIATEVWKSFHSKWDRSNGPFPEGKFKGEWPAHTPIPLGFGVDSIGKPFVEDLTLMPHLLIAGTTGGGKSTLIKSLIASIVYTINSSTVQLVMSDTKGVEFTSFAGLPHLMFPIATDVMTTFEQMDFLIEETERRLKKFPKHHATNVNEWNSACSEQERMALIVLLIDECADLTDMKKLFEAKMGKITQKSRAAGIHVIAATQRPSAKMIEGTIKANMQARLSFRLPSQVDSRVALTHDGAQYLMMRGDMLYYSAQRGLIRLHSAKAKPEDIKSAIEMAIHNG